MDALTLSLWSVIPFVGMLLSIAIMPLVIPAWYEKHQLLVAVGWALLFCIPFAIIHGGHELAYELAESVVLDYIPFIVLLLGLFIVTGGIAVKGLIAGTTRNNVIMLVVGTLLSSWIGTTGSAMLLIRPLLRANAWRKYKAHIVIFFIFLVANIGGCLTPLGDPPLFLGYLRGVPFFWTMQHIWPLLLLNTVVLCVVFALIDRHYVKKETAEGRSSADLLAPGEKPEKLHIEGGINFLYIVIILIAVILNGALSDISQAVRVHLIDDVYLGLNFFVQVGLILLACVLSLKTTPKHCREHNEFGYGPIAEVTVRAEQHRARQQREENQATEK